MGRDPANGDAHGVRASPKWQTVAHVGCGYHKSMDASSAQSAGPSRRAGAFADGRGAPRREGALATGHSDVTVRWTARAGGDVVDAAAPGQRFAVVDDAALLGRRFPVVGGAALSGERVRLPYDLLGAPALLLVAYRRQAHADVVRWTEMLGREAPRLRVIEIPVITALVWRLLQGWIDGGMRGAVPMPQWSNIVTVYGDAPIVRDFVGDPGVPVATALLLDAGGVVRAVESGGFDGDACTRLTSTLAALTRV